MADQNSVCIPLTSSFWLLSNSTICRTIPSSDQLQILNSSLQDTCYIFSLILFIFCFLKLYWYSNISDLHRFKKLTITGKKVWSKWHVYGFPTCEDMHMLTLPCVVTPQQCFINTLYIFFFFFTVKPCAVQSARWIYPPISGFFFLRSI